MKCKHCGKEITTLEEMGEICDKNPPVNNVPLSHGLTLEDYVSLLKDVHASNCDQSPNLDSGRTGASEEGTEAASE